MHLALDLIKGFAGDFFAGRPEINAAEVCFIPLNVASRLYTMRVS